MMEALPTFSWRWGTPVELGSLSARGPHPAAQLQVFVNGEFIGGCDILMGMHDSGELEKLLAPVREVQKAK